MKKVKGSLLVTQVLSSDCPYCGKNNEEIDYGENDIFDYGKNEATCEYCKKDYIVEIDE